MLSLIMDAGDGVPWGADGDCDSGEIFMTRVNVWHKRIGN